MFPDLFETVLQKGDLYDFVKGHLDRLIPIDFYLPPLAKVQHPEEKMLDEIMLFERATLSLEYECFVEQCTVQNIDAMVMVLNTVFDTPTHDRVQFYKRAVYNTLSNVTSHVDCITVQTAFPDGKTAGCYFDKNYESGGNTLAHEIGHGIFGLYHHETFGSHHDGDAIRNCLMDPKNSAGFMRGVFCVEHKAILEGLVRR